MRRFTRASTVQQPPTSGLTTGCESPAKSTTPPSFSPKVSNKQRNYSPIRAPRHSISVDYGDVLPAGCRSRPSNLLPPLKQGTPGGARTPPKERYRVVFLGAARVGKSAIIHQFLYEKFLNDYSATVEEFHRAEYDVGLEHKVSLDILDTGGSCEFPAMRRLAIGSGDAFVLVFAVDNNESFEYLRHIREEVISVRSNSVKPPPIVIVANKVDLEEERRVKTELVEPIVCMDWEHVYVECSAKQNQNVLQIFQELLSLSNLKKRSHHPKLGFGGGGSVGRRMSLPVSSMSEQLAAFSMKHSGTGATKKKRDSCHVS